MRAGITVIAVLMLSGCAAQRAAERAAPNVPFAGPLGAVKLSPAQIELVQKGITDNMKDKTATSFGSSYRAGRGPDGDIVVCGFVNGKRFVGVLATPVGDSTEFLPIKVAITEEEQADARRYCRADGIYLPE